MFSDYYKRRGFTLLEVVCTLVILGVLGGLVFSGFGSALTGYAQMRASVSTYMQTELALIRIRKELAGVFDGFELKEDGATLSFLRADGTAVTMRVDKNNYLILEVKSSEPPPEKKSSGPLLGGVKAVLFRARYPQNGSALPDLITVTFTLEAPAGPATYSLTVSPRNTPPSEG